MPAKPIDLYNPGMDFLRGTLYAGEFIMRMNSPYVEFTENETKKRGILWKILVKMAWIVYNITMK